MMNDIQNYPFCRLTLMLKRSITQLDKPTNQDSVKSPKLFSQRMRKRYYKTLGSSVINSPFFPLYLLQCNLMIILSINFKFYDFKKISQYAKMF